MVKPTKGKSVRDVKQPASMGRIILARLVLVKKLLICIQLKKDNDHAACGDVLRHLTNNYKSVINKKTLEGLR